MLITLRQAGCEEISPALMVQESTHSAAATMASYQQAASKVTVIVGAIQGVIKEYRRHGRTTCTVPGCGIEFAKSLFWNYEFEK